MPIHRPLVLSILIYGHHELSRTRHCSLSFRQHRPRPCVLYEENTRTVTEEEQGADTQVVGETPCRRVFDLFSGATLHATEFPGVDVPATVDPRLEHADKQPPDIDVETIFYQKRPLLSGSLALEPPAFTPPSSSTPLILRWYHLSNS